MADKYINDVGLRRVVDWVVGKLGCKSDTTHSHAVATTTASGFLSVADKINLDTAANMQIGGRNLQLGSENWDDTAFYLKGSAIISGNELTIPLGLTNTATHFITANAGDEITVGYDVKSDANNTEEENRILIFEFFDSSNERFAVRWDTGAASTNWSRKSLTVTLPTGTVKFRLGLRSSYNVTNTYRHLKVENGNKMTDWTPAPEDIASIIAWAAVSGMPIQISKCQGGVPFNDIVVSGRNLYAATINAFPNGTILAVNENARCVWAKCKNDTTYTITRTGGSKMQCYSTNVLPAAGVVCTAIKQAVDQTASQFTVTTGAKAKYIVFYLSGTGETIADIQIEQNDTATDYIPSIVGRSQILNVSGKNMITYDSAWIKSRNTGGTWVGDSYTISGITYSLDGYGQILANGTATADSAFYFANRIAVPAGIFTASGCTGGSNTTYLIQMGTDDWSAGFGVYSGSTTHILTTSKVLSQCRILVNAGTTVNNVMFCPQLEIGNIATDYAPYNGETYTITPDINPYDVTVDVRQVAGINNIWIVDDSNPTLSVNYNRTNPSLLMLQKQLDAMANATVLGGE